MKKTITLLSLSLLLTFLTQVKAQEISTTDTTTRGKITLSATIATQGVGLDVKFSPIPQFAVRVGASILPIRDGGVYKVRSEPTDVDFDVNFANAHLMFDWHPFLKETGLLRKVVFTAGAAYFWEAKGDVVVSYRGTYKYGDILIPSSDLGQLYGSVEWKKVAPYLGFGFENVFPAKKFNVGFAVGAYYLGAPDATLIGTNYLSQNSSNQEQLQKNMNDYRFMPVLQVNFNFSL